MADLNISINDNVNLSENNSFFTDWLKGVEVYDRVSIKDLFGDFLNPESSSLDQFLNDSNQVCGYDGWEVSGSYYIGQSFTTGNYKTITNIKTMVGRDGNLSVAGDLTLRLYLSDINNFPTGTALASKTLFSSQTTLGSGPTDFTDFIFDIPVSVNPNTKYVFTIEAPDTLPTDSYCLLIDSCQGYAGGLFIESTDSGLTWDGSYGGDLGFEVYATNDTVQSSIPLLDGVNPYDSISLSENNGMLIANDVIISENINLNELIETTISDSAINLSDSVNFTEQTTFTVSLSDINIDDLVNLQENSDTNSSLADISISEIISLGENFNKSVPLISISINDNINLTENNTFESFLFALRFSGTTGSNAKSLATPVSGSSSYLKTPMGSKGRSL